MFIKNVICWFNKLGVEDILDENIIHCEILVFKWMLLVWLNVLVVFYFAIMLYGESVNILGVILGVLTFVVFYVAIDCQLIKHKSNKIRGYFHSAILLKLLTQFILIMDILAAMLSVKFIEIINFPKIPFILPYLITLVYGVLFTIIIALLMLAMKSIVSIISLVARRLG
jgi:hypothetical protein